MALHIDYYVSLNSPWTHLGAARIEAMAMANNAALRVFPVDFGAIFAAVRRFAAAEARAAAAGIPAAWNCGAGATIWASRSNSSRNSFRLTRRCRRDASSRCGKRSGDQPAVKLAHRVLKALWQEEKNPGDPATLAGLITDVGLDADQVMKLGRRTAMGRAAGGRHEGGAGSRRVRCAQLCHRRRYFLGPGPAGVRRASPGARLMRVFTILPQRHWREVGPAARDGRSRRVRCADDGRARSRPAGAAGVRRAGDRAGGTDALRGRRVSRAARPSWRSRPGISTPIPAVVSCLAWAAR